MTNEQIVEKIRNGYSVTDNMQWLYEKNMPLIKRILKPYTAYESIEDLLQEAYFGLWEAVQHYETSENVLFMTYAGYWIRQSAQRYIEKCGSVVKIPTATRQKIIRYNKTVQRLLQEQSRVPTDKEIADCMMITVSEVEELKQYSQSVASLDAPLSEDADITLCDNVQSDFELENETIDKIYAEHTKDELWGIVEQYTSDIENKVIADRYKQDMTYRDIGIKNNISMQRARDIEHSALRKLRIGKAKRRLLEKFEVVESGMYKTGFNSFNQHNFTSRVEFIAIRKAEIQEEHERRMRELSQYIPQKRACL